MSKRTHKESKAEEIREYLKTHPRKTTGEIAKAVNWTSSRVAATLWAEIRREPRYIVKDTIPPTGKRKTPIYVYTHVDYMMPAETTKPKLGVLPPAETTKPKLGVLPPAEARQVCVEEHAKRPEPEGTLTDFADALAQAIARHVVSRVKRQLERQLQAILPPLEPDPAPLSIEELTARVMSPAPHKTKAATVLIAGLLPNQAGIIEKEFGEVFDLRFYMIGHSLKQLAAMAANVDHVFTFTSKVSHAVEEVMVGKGHKVHRCSGGMTMLKDQLLKLYMGEL